MFASVSPIDQSKKIYIGKAFVVCIDQLMNVEFVTYMSCIVIYSCD